MINIVEGQAQVNYMSGVSTWAIICDELETIYPMELYTSINAYGTIWIIESMADVLAATDILKTWSDF
jgi:hypothetical protein